MERERERERSVKEMGQELKGTVALVTGASRGIGKGIARGLAEKGATVYVTARTVEKTRGKTGSLRQTVEEIEALGGVGRAVQCDHSKDEEVKQLFERIGRECGGTLDVLVNNATTIDSGKKFVAPFWEQGPEMWDAFHAVGLRSHYVASCYAVPLLRKSTRKPLVVNVSSFGGLAYTFNVAYSVGKGALDRLTADMAIDLEPLGIACISLWPGIVRTERILELENKAGAGADADDKQEKDEMWSETKEFDLSKSESPLFSGRCVAALAMDTKESLMGMTGTIVVAAEAASRYGIKDEDGSQPWSIRSLPFALDYSIKVFPKALLNPLRNIHIPFGLFRKGKYLIERQERKRLNVTSKSPFSNRSVKLR